jgi:hypothetical protein
MNIDLRRQEETSMKSTLQNIRRLTEETTVKDADNIRRLTEETTVKDADKDLEIRRLQSQQTRT